MNSEPAPRKGDRVIDRRDRPGLVVGPDPTLFPRPTSVFVTFDQSRRTVLVAVSELRVTHFGGGYESRT